MWFKYLRCSTVFRLVINFQHNLRAGDIGCNFIGTYIILSVIA